MKISKILTKEFLEKELKTKYAQEIANETGLGRSNVSRYIRKYGLLPSINPWKKMGERHLGKKYSRLVIIEIIEFKNNSLYVKCKCDCGKEKIIEHRHIADGAIKSCGCLKQDSFKERSGKKHHSWTGYEEISGQFFCSIKLCAKKRNIKFDLTIEYIWKLYIKQNKKCKISGMELSLPKFTDDFNKTASLDRIDSKKGYIKGNVQWIHKDINKMKMDLDQNYFINLCKTITYYNE